MATTDAGITNFTALANQNRTVNTGLPAYLQPFFDRALNRAESAATEAYKPYTGQLTAGLSPLETQAGNNAANLQTPGQFTSAGNIYNQAAQGLMGLTNFEPGTFGATQAQQYMNPYVQNVTDIQKREAQRDFDKQQSQLRARVGAAGAFGGSRATLLETENQRNQNQLLDDIQQKGLAAAYLNAQDMFNKDREARFAAANLGLQGYTGATNAAQGLASLGTNIGQDARANIGLQADLGKVQRDQQQGGLDRQLQMFLDERGDPLTKANAFSGILANLSRGQSTQQNVGPELSTLDKILGFSAQGASLLNMIGGNNGAGAGLGSLLQGGSALIGGVSNLFKDGGALSGLGTSLSGLFSDVSDGAGSLINSLFGGSSTGTDNLIGGFDFDLSNIG